MINQHLNLIIHEFKHKLNLINRGSDSLRRQTELSRRNFRERRKNDLVRRWKRERDENNSSYNVARSSLTEHFSIYMSSFELANGLVVKDSYCSYSALLLLCDEFVKNCFPFFIFIYFREEYVYTKIDCYSFFLKSSYSACF